MQGFGSGGPRRVKVVSVTPTISTSAYTSGDALGGEMEFAGVARVAGGGGIIRGITVFDKDAESPALDLVIFHENPTGTTTDNAAWDMSDSDGPKVAGAGSIAATDWWVFVDNAVVYLEKSIPFKCAAGSDSVYGVLVIRSADTFTSTTDITVTLSVEQD